jgi:DNA polymerase III alpha subunit (gram-positive type)
MPFVIYFCIDCEASGPVPPLFNLLSIGATVVRPENGRHVLGASFYVELQPIFPGFDPGAMAVCGLDADHLRRSGTEPKEALTRLARFVADENAGSADAPCFVGHNAVFDWSHIAYYYAHFGMDNPFGYKGLDTKSLAMGRLGISWRATSKENLEHMLELPAQDPAQIHRADYDAHYQALILIALLDRRS